MNAPTNLHNRLPALVAAAASLLLPVLAAAGEATIKGSAFYLERIALPENALFEATLEDVSVADAPAPTLGKAKIAPAGQVPIAFSILYNPDDIQQGRRYSVRAQIRVDGELRFTTDTIHPVLAGGEHKELKLRMRMVRATPAKSVAASGKQAATSPFTEYSLHFLGLLPGANLETRYQLDLFSNHAYFLMQQGVKNGKESEPNYDIGRWRYEAETKRLVLKGGREAPLYFAVLDAGTIEKMDLQGNKIESELSYKLEESKTARTLEPKTFMQGMYQYMADAALFRDCTTGLKLAVAFEGDHAALEPAYLEAASQPGAPLKVHVEGAIVQRPSMEGDGPKPHLVVERFIKTIPKETCGNPFVDASLTNTYWRLTALDGTPIGRGAPGKREAHMILRAGADGSGRLAGSTGCNRMMGGYTMDGQELELSSMGTTLMACLEGGIEREYLAALEAAKGWRIKGDHLELLGDGETPVARFEAIYLR